MPECLNAGDRVIDTHGRTAMLAGLGSFQVHLSCFSSHFAPTFRAHFWHCRPARPGWWEWSVFMWRSQNSGGCLIICIVFNQVWIVTFSVQNIGDRNTVLVSKTIKIQRHSSLKRCSRWIRSLRLWCLTGLIERSINFKRRKKIFSRKKNQRN